MSIGNLITSLRERKGMTRSKLADVLGISASSLGYYERDEREPTATLILRMAEFFNTTPDFLLGVDERNAPRTTISLEAVLKFLETEEAEQNHNHLHHGLLGSNEYTRAYSAGSLDTLGKLKTVIKKELYPKEGDDA